MVSLSIFIKSAVEPLIKTLLVVLPCCWTRTSSTVSISFIFLWRSPSFSTTSDAALAPEDLLYRLFHEDGVRVFTPLPLVAACRCSRQRMQELLAGFPHADIADMVEDEAITATCKFCNLSGTIETGGGAP